MASGDYLITRTNDGHWLLRFDGQHMASFPEKRQAIRAAVTLVNVAGLHGKNARVFGVDDHGLVYPSWKCGRDTIATGD